MPKLNTKGQHTAALLKIHKQIGIAQRRRRLPRQIQPKAIERSYYAALKGILARLRQSMAPLMAELPNLLVSAKVERHDVGEGKRITELVAQAKTKLQLSTTDIEDLARKFARQTQTYQRVQLGRQLKAGLGIDPFINDRNLARLTEGFVHENVSLIKSLTDRVASDVEGVVLRGVQNGMLQSDLADKIAERFQVGEDRAALIARDQIGKAYSDVNAQRQQDLGITHFIWRTAGDERVRDEHEALDGEEFAYDDPPDEGLPGDAVNCRCYAEPVLDEIIQEAE